MKRTYQSFIWLLLLAILLTTGCRKDNEQIRKKVATAINRENDHHQNIKEQLQDLSGNHPHKHLK